VAKGGPFVWTVFCPPKGLNAFIVLHGPVYLLYAQPLFSINHLKMVALVYSLGSEEVG